jgi:hypothetical protein
MIFDRKLKKGSRNNSILKTYSEEPHYLITDTYFKTLDTEDVDSIETTRPLTAFFTKTRPQTAVTKTRPQTATSLSRKKSRKLTAMSENYLNTSSENVVSRYLHSIDAQMHAPKIKFRPVSKRRTFVSMNVDDVIN